jgi:hypothetical protein
VQPFPVLSAVALICCIAMILRPAILRGGTTPEDRARFQELVHTCGSALSVIGGYSRCSEIKRD